MHMPVLTTARLTIRPFTMDDLDPIHDILDRQLGDDFSREERAAWLHWSALAAEWLGRLYQPPYGDRALVLRATGELIGACGYAPALLPFNQLPHFGGRSLAAGGTAPPLAEVGNTSEVGLYWAVAPAHRRRGYATEAGRALIDYAFADLNLARIVATTTYDNAASIGVMAKLGMEILQNPHPTPPYMQVVGVLER